jgi:hypothetical protein
MSRLQRVRILAAPTPTLSAGKVKLLRLAYLAGIAIAVLGIVQIFWLESPYRFWLFFGAGTALVLVFWWLGQGFRELYEPLLRQRQQELAERLVRGETLRVRGTPGVFLPFMLSLIALTFVLPAGVTTTLAGRVWLLAGVVLLASFWYWAVPRLRAPILELDRTGLRTPSLGQVSWADIETAQLRVSGSLDNSFIASHVLSLEFVIDRHPRPAHGLRRRAQAFFRGMREWEARIPLRNPSENPLVILNLTMFCIRNTPRYQEQRRVRRMGPPESLQDFAPHDLPGLPLSRGAVAAKTSSPAGTPPPGPARRIVRQRFIRRSAAQRLPQWVVISALLLIFVLCHYGLRVNFFCSEAWSRTSIFVCIAIAAVPCWYLGRAIMWGPIYNPDVSTPFMRALVAWILSPALVYALCWSIAASALPDIFTRMAGTRFRETHSLRKEYSYERRRCDYRIVGSPFEEGSLKNHFCSWSGEYDQLPNTGLMVVRGRQTWLGRHIDSVEPVAAYDR